MGGNRGGVKSAGGVQTASGAVDSSAMATHFKLLWCPPVVARLCVIVLGFGLFLSITSTVRPRTSQAAVGGDEASPAMQVGAADQRSALGVGDPRLDPRAVYPNPAPRPPVADATPDALVNAPRFDPVGNALIGALVGSDHMIWVYSSAAGPLYSVADRSGQVLATGLLAAQVFERFPSIPVTELRMLPVDSPAGGPLMSAEPLR